MFVKLGRVWGGFGDGKKTDHKKIKVNGNGKKYSLTAPSTRGVNLSKFNGIVWVIFF